MSDLPADSEKDPESDAANADDDRSLIAEDEAEITEGFAGEADGEREPPPPPFWPRMVIGAVLVALIGCGWIAMDVQRATRRDAAAQIIVEAGGRVQFSDANGAAQPGLISRLLGVNLKRKALAIGLPPKITDQVVSALRFLRTAETLSAAGSNLTDSQLPQILDDRLRNLSLKKTQISDAALAPLRHLPQLRRLDLRECPRLTAEGVRLLESFSDLSELRLDGLQIPADAVDAVRQKLPQTRVTF